MSVIIGLVVFFCLNPFIITSSGEFLQDFLRARSNGFLALSATLDHPVTTYGRARLAGQLTERTIREQLLPTLVAGEAPDPSDLVERAWSVVEPLLNVTADEAEFLAGIECGDYLPHLLGDPHVVELEEHPAIQWKLHNVREHLRRQAGGRSPAVRPEGGT